MVEEMATEVNILSQDPGPTNLEVADDLLDAINLHVMGELGEWNALFATRGAGATSHGRAETLSLPNSGKVLVGTEQLLVSKLAAVPAWEHGLHRGLLDQSTDGGATPSRGGRCSALSVDGLDPCLGSRVAGRRRGRARSGRWFFHEDRAINTITWKQVGAVGRGDGFEVWEAGLWPGLAGLADWAPGVKGVVAVWGCSPCSCVGKLDVLDVDALPFVLLRVPVLWDHDVEDVGHNSAPDNLELHVCSRAKAVLSEEVRSNTHSSCETIVVGWQVVEGLDVSPMDGDGGHSEVGVEGVDAELVGGRPASLANLVSVAEGLGNGGVARVGNLDIGVGGRHEGSAGEAGSDCEWSWLVGLVWNYCL
jgi:hypothetical protein